VSVIFEKKLLDTQLKRYLDTQKYISYPGTMSLLKRILDFTTTILFFCGFVYLIALFLHWSKVAPIPPMDSKQIFGYMSLTHVISIPIFWFGMRKQYGSFYMLFLVVNTVWIVLVCIGFGLIYGGALGQESQEVFKSSSLHNAFIYSYFSMALVAEIAVFIVACKLQRSLKVIQESDSDASKVATTTTTQKLLPQK
jgi:hypothetical protein